MAKIILMRGLPASGKSTYAKQLVEKNGNCKRISRDSLREMIDVGKWNESKEKTIRKAELTLAELFLSLGFVSIIDDCNLSPSAMTMWQEFAKRMKAEVEIKDFTDVPLETCLERDRKRPNYAGEQVIRKMYRDFLQPQPVQPAYNPSLPDALIIDLDGTLALMGDRNPYDASLCEEDSLNTPVADSVTRYQQDGYSILLVSGRKEDHRPQTERWLQAHHISYHALYMRSTGDNRRDYIIKRELYEQHIQGNYNILFAIDDRKQVVQVWREQLGLTCFQVAEGDY